MKRLTIFFTLLFLVSLHGRENPFDPIITQQQSGKVANTPEPNYFSPQSLQLPSSARKIKNIIIEFQNMDGSTDAITKELDNEIDWHFPILVLQQSLREKQTKEQKEEIKEISKSIEKNEQPKISQSKKLAPLSFVSFDIDDKTINIDVKDELIRDFALAEPTKIVLDFKRDANFYSKNIDTGVAFYKNIAIGNHDKYYRVAIELDGKYRYKLEKTEDGYRITLE